jgi:hypothetical protein
MIDHTRRPHDLGGLSATAIDQSGHDFAYWEKQIDSIMRLVSDKERGLLTVDELRRNVEELGPDVYKSLSYYERWILALSDIFLQKGVFTVDEMGRKMSDVERSWAADRAFKKEHSPHDPAHHHDHEGPHPHQADIEDKEATRYQVMAKSVTELLIEKAVFSADTFRQQLEKMDAKTPADGARMIARAWVDDVYKKRMLADVNAAAVELGLDAGSIPIRAVENTPALHNVIVCTLCSCYPRMLIGLPPDWYKSHAYRSRTVREPRVVLKEFGTIIPDDIEIRVHDSTADCRYMVVPMQPTGTEGLSEDALADLVTRDCMIGVAVVKAPNDHGGRE